MDKMQVMESIFRWFHVIAGIIWIGHLYFFNFVNSQFAPTMDGDSKKKVIPELMPRALYFFRWGALWTWLTGVLLLGLVFHRFSSQMFVDNGDWHPAGGAMVGLAFLGFIIYDLLAKGPIKDPVKAFWGGAALATLAVLLFHHVGKFSYRATAIHLGTLLGTSMAFNVWFRIWPAQQQIITAIKNGEAPNGDLVAMAGLRSKHNTFMSVPLVFLMLNAHGTWAAMETTPGSPGPTDLYLPLIVLVGFAFTQHLYSTSKTVKGF